jgi:hypothetical protein
MLFDGGSLARTRRRGDNAGMAGDDGRAQVQLELDEDTLGRRRRDLGEDHPDTLASADALAVSLRAAGEYQAARELDEDTLARRRRVLGDEHPETMMAGAFDLILRGLDLGGEPGWMAALREASKRRQQEARELNEDEPG